ncbi:MAG: UDPGP type 1 family protein [Planctomycetes bacterium]|nr:UDPGP type 1 family protein [Planctomycetota bacterium]
MDSSQKHLQFKEKLAAIGQEHILAFYDGLNDESKADLLDQISRLDLERTPDWVDNYVKNAHSMEIPPEIDPATSYPCAPCEGSQSEYAKAREIGEKLLSEGKVGAFVVAGGQGTRLGFDGPKGDFPVSPIKGKTLFRIFGETILAASIKYGAPLPWYVMTSPLNNAATVESFEKNAYFGLKKEDVFIFQQGTLPNFDFDGNILLSAKDTIAKSPDGHGGSLKALFDSGAIADMQNRGVEYISYFQVDNPLINIFSPLFIGFHAVSGSEMSSRALIKSHPKEKIGNFCIVEGKMTVIEYSDLPDEYAEKCNADGSLIFELGSIAIHLISRSFVEDLNRDGFALPIHRAVKKIPYIDATGAIVDPDEPNGVKLETFVFDALPLAERSVILQTLRQEEFAPVKNAEGDDSPAVTRDMMIERAASWLEKAGVTVPRLGGIVDCVIEMAPSFALCVEDIEAKLDEIPELKAGGEYYLK